MKKIAVLILAAGNSSRMKHPKQLVKIGNNFLLEMVLSKGKSLDVKDVWFGYQKAVCVNKCHEIAIFGCN